MTTILLADDHHVVRDGLHALLAAEPDFTIVGEAADGFEAVRLVERLRPEVLLIDLMMPGLMGLEVTRQVSERSPRTRVLILSMHADESYVLEALRDGAAAYILKDAHAADVIHAVHEVMAGRRYLSPPLSERAMEAYLEKAQNAAPSDLDSLTAREREVLHLAAAGCTNSEVGAQLSISRRTAETHRANVMRKLGLHTQTDLVRYAIRRGLIPLDE